VTKGWLSKGQELTEDIYSGTMQGLVHCISTIYKGVRSSSAVFVEGRSNVTVLPLTHAKKIIIEGNKATGATVLLPTEVDRTFKAKREVIVSGGVFESPKLLMLSGIGPKEELSKFGIKHYIQSPHVGQHLQDHPILAHVFRLKGDMGLDDHVLRAGLQRDAAVSAYNHNHSGPLSSGLLELVAFPRIDEQLNRVPEYAKAKEENGGRDPFGRGGQPHFEIDFVVSISTLSLFKCQISL
jgi:choline dehydrogenase-like flavoprotein